MGLTAPSFFDTLSEAERELVMNTPVGSRAALEHEMQILKFREHRILTKIIEYEQAPEDELYLNSVLDMRQPAGRGDKKIDGARQQMGMYSKDSAFARVLKLQDALYKVQGRIAKIADSLRALEENEKRLELEKKRLEILRMRATGVVETPGPGDRRGRGGALARWNGECRWTRNGLKTRTPITRRRATRLRAMKS